MHDTFAEIDVPKLSDVDKAKLDGPITLKEASVALKNMKSDKSPGSDGFTSEFFKVFWKRLGPFVTRSLNYGYETGELSVTQKEGIITCIPKENKPKQFLKQEPQGALIAHLSTMSTSVKS